MITIIVQGISSEDFFALINRMVSDEPDGSQVFGSSECIDIELYDDENDQTCHGAKALNKVIEYKRQKQKGEQNDL